MRARQLRQGLLLGGLFLVAFWLVSLIWGIAGKVQIAVSQAGEGRRQYAALEVRRETLEANLAELNTPRGKDAAIRTAFGVAKAGEELIVVVPPATVTPPKAKPWWRRALDWF